MECHVTILPSFLIVGLDENLTDQWLSNIQTVNIRSPYMAYHIHCQVSTLTIALINTTIIAINSSLLNTQSYATLCMSYIYFKRYAMIPNQLQNIYITIQKPACNYQLYVSTMIHIMLPNIKFQSAYNICAYIIIYKMICYHPFAICNI